MSRMNISHAVAEFLTFERMARGLAPSSARLYGAILGQFVRFVGADKTIVAASPGVELFLISRAQQGIGDHARRKAFDVVRLFYRWALERGIAPANPLRDARAPIIHAKPRSFLTRAEVCHLLNTIKRSGGEHAERDHAIFSCMFFAGLRVSEALRLRVQDYAPARGLLSVFGKGSKVRNVPVHPELEKTLNAWLRRRQHGGDLLFPSHAAGWHRTGHLDNSRIELVLRDEYAPRARLAGRVTPHTLRRSFATELRARGVPIEHVQALLGHADIRTTMIYLAESVEGLNASVRKL